MSLSLLCFGSLFCSVLCVPIWRNNTQKRALILLFAVIIISDMSSETNEQFLSDNSALEGASFFFGLRSSPEQEQNEYTVLNS